MTSSLISLLYGITSGGVLHSWNSAAVITSIVIGTCGTAVFLLYEELFAKEPMIPLRIFKNRSAAAAYVSAFVLGFVLWAMQYYLILYVRAHLLISERQQVLTVHSKVLRHSTPFTFGIGRCYPPRYAVRPHRRCRRRIYHLQTAAIPYRQLDLVAFGDSWVRIDDTVEN